MGKITVEVKINTFGTMTHPTIICMSFFQNNKQKMDYFLKQQALDDKKEITGCYCP